VWSGIICSLQGRIKSSVGLGLKTQAPQAGCREGGRVLSPLKEGLGSLNAYFAAFSSRCHERSIADELKYLIRPKIDVSFNRSCFVLLGALLCGSQFCMYFLSAVSSIGSF